MSTIRPKPPWFDDIPDAEWAAWCEQHRESFGEAYWHCGLAWQEFWRLVLAELRKSLRRWWP